MSTRVLIIALIRHGDYHQPPGMPSAQLPHPLTDLGRKQARDGALKILQFCSEQRLKLGNVLLCSSLLRAYETGRIICDTIEEIVAKTLSIEQTDLLSERSLGSLANLTTDEIAEVIQNDPRVEGVPGDWKINSRFRLPFIGAESQIEAGKRVFDYLQEKFEAISTLIDEDTLLPIVGHGGSIRHACHHFQALALEKIPGLSMYHCEPIYFRWEGDGRLKHMAGDWKLRNKEDASID